MKPAMPWDAFRSSAHVACQWMYQMTHQRFIGHNILSDGTRRSPKNNGSCYINGKMDTFVEINRLNSTRPDRTDQFIASTIVAWSIQAHFEAGNYVQEAYGKMPKEDQFQSSLDSMATAPDRCSSVLPGSAQVEDGYADQAEIEMCLQTNEIDQDNVESDGNCGL